MQDAIALFTKTNLFGTIITINIWFIYLFYRIIVINKIYKIKLQESQRKKKWVNMIIQSCTPYTYTFFYRNRLINLTEIVVHQRKKKAIMEIFYYKKYWNLLI